MKYYNDVYESKLLCCDIVALEMSSGFFFLT